MFEVQERDNLKKKQKQKAKTLLETQESEEFSEANRVNTSDEEVGYLHSPFRDTHQSGF